nr:hypothetical protein [Tanacetum cinerariifolium]
MTHKWYQSQVYHLEEVAAEVPNDAEVHGRQEESQAQVYHLDLEHAQKVLKVVTATATTITAAPSATRRRKGVVIRDPKKTATPSTIVHSKPKSNDKEKGILVQKPKPLKKQAQIEQDEAYARELEAELNANINWDDVIEQPKNFLDDFLLNTLKAMFKKLDVEAHIWKNQRGSYGLAEVKSWKLLESYGVHIITFTTTQMILLVERRYPLTRAGQKEGKARQCSLEIPGLKRKPQTEAHARKNMMVYLKNMAGFKMDFFKGMSYDDIRPIFERHFNYIVGFLEKGEEQLKEEVSKALKRKSESPEQQAAKKQKLDEEVKELKTHLQIVPNDEDDVYTEATHLALKPKNFLDDFLLNTLKAMFKKLDVEAHIWKNQRGSYGLAEVKSWKLLESYGVHIITFTTTQMILLVERRYPLTSKKDTGQRKEFGYILHNDQAG